MDKFLTAKETIAKLNIKDFQLFDLMKQGLLQAYTEYGKKVINSDELERKPRDTLETILANQKAKRNATTLGGTGSHRYLTDEELLETAKRLYRLQSLAIVNQPPDTEAISFIELSNNMQLAIKTVMKFLFTDTEITSLQKDDGSSNETKTKQESPIPLKSEPLNKDNQAQAMSYKDTEWGDNYFVLSGDHWKVSFNKSKEVTITGLKGMKYIAYLLSNQGQYIQILKLTTGLEGEEHTVTEEYDKVTGEQLSDIGMRSIDEPILDKHNYKDMKEARRLLAELEKAKKTGSQMEIEEARQEYMDYLNSLKQDNVDPQLEKERKRIHKLIKTAIDNIGKKHSELGEHLRAAITTGVSCSYTYQEEPIDWYVKY